MEKKLLQEMRFMMERIESPRMTDTEYQKRKELMKESSEGDKIDESAASNLELKSLAKKIYSGFKNMGAKVKFMDYQKLKTLGSKGELPEEDVIVTIGGTAGEPDAVNVSLFGDKAISFEDEIKKSFSKFNIKDHMGGIRFRDNAKVRSLTIYPGKETS